jgi:hypothetical protein
MNTTSADNRVRRTLGGTSDALTTAFVSRKLERAELERMMKTAVQSDSAGQVAELDAALLVGCVDWYQYASSGSERRSS